MKLLEDLKSEVGSEPCFQDLSWLVSDLSVVRAGEKWALEFSLDFASSLGKTQLGTGKDAGAKADWSSLWGKATGTVS